MFIGIILRDDEIILFIIVFSEIVDGVFIIKIFWKWVVLREGIKYINESVYFE